MATLIRPRAWAQKPPPNVAVLTGHPLANGLQNALLFAEGGGSSTMDSFRDRTVPITYGQGTPAWSGDGLTFNGSVSGTTPEQVNVDPGLAQTSTNPGPATLLASVLIAGNTTGGVIGIEGGDIGTNGASTTRGIWMGIGNAAGFSNGAAGVDLTALNENVAWQTPGSPIAIPIGQWAQIAIQFAGFSSTASFYVNGLLRGTTSIGGGAAGTAAAMRLMVGGYYSANGAANRVFTGAIRYAYHWSRLLTPAELEWLAIDPYAMFVGQSRQSRFWPATVTPAAGGTGPLAILPTHRPPVMPLSPRGIAV